MTHEVDTSERRLLTSYRARMVRLANLVGWATIIVVLLYTFLHPRHEEMTSHTAIWGILALAGATNIATYSKPFLRLLEGRSWRIVIYVWCVLLIMFASLMVYLSGEFASEMYLVYLPMILFASGVLDPKGQAMMTALAVLSYLAVSYPALSGEIGTYLMRFAAFGVVGLMGSYVAREHRREVTRHAFQERQARKRAYQLASLNEAASTIASEMDSQRLLEKLTHVARLFVGAEAGMLLVKDKGDQSKFRFLISTQTSSPMQAKPPENGPLIQVLNSGKSIRLDHREVNHITLNLPSYCPPIKNLLGIPLISRGEVTGCLFVANKLEEDDFAEEDEVLLATLSAQAAVAIANVLLYEEVQRKEELRGELLQKVITAQEEERKRVARELHDETGQSLSTVIVGISAVENSLPKDMAPVKEHLSRIKSMMTQALTDIRKLILDLRPSVLDDLGLAAALRWYAKSHLEASGVDVTLETRRLDRKRFPPEMEIALFRIVQESINNIVKHAGASQARLRLELSDNAVFLEVEDNGQGFDIHEVRMSRDRARGLGILGMQERVALFGGKFHIESHAGRGTRIRVEVPLGGGR